MSSIGPQAKSGLGEVVVSLVFGLLSSALIHRVATTICFFFSIGILVFLTGIAHTRYTRLAPSAHNQAAAAAGGGKKRKWLLLDVENRNLF